VFYPIFWGCKYTNKIRIINNIPVFQRIILLITSSSPPEIPPSAAIPQPQNTLTHHGTWGEEEL
jgi:hypothetical protein